MKHMVMYWGQWPLGLVTILLSTCLLLEAHGASVRQTKVDDQQRPGGLTLELVAFDEPRDASDTLSFFLAIKNSGRLPQLVCELSRSVVIGRGDVAGDAAGGGVEGGIHSCRGVGGSLVLPGETHFLPVNTVYEGVLRDSTKIDVTLAVSVRGPQSTQRTQLTLTRIRSLTEAYAAGARLVAPRFRNQ